MLMKDASGKIFLFYYITDIAGNVLSISEYL